MDISLGFCFRISTYLIKLKQKLLKVLFTENSIHVYCNTVNAQTSAKTDPTFKCGFDCSKSTHYFMFFDSLPKRWRKINHYETTAFITAFFESAIAVFFDSQKWRYHKLVWLSIKRTETDVVDWKLRLKSSDLKEWHIARTVAWRRLKALCKESHSFYMEWMLNRCGCIKQKGY